MYVVRYACMRTTILTFIHVTSSLRLKLKLDYSTYHVAINAIHTGAYTLTQHTFIGRCSSLTIVGPGQTLLFSHWRIFVVADVRRMAELCNGVDDTLYIGRPISSVNFYTNQLMFDDDHQKWAMGRVEEQCI